MAENNVVDMRQHRKDGKETSTDDVPDFITRVDISQMNDDELDLMLESIRLRRMTAVMIHQETVADREKIEQERARERVDKKCEMIERKLASTQKQLDVLEKYINELRGLRIQAGLEII